MRTHVSCHSTGSCHKNGKAAGKLCKGKCICFSSCSCSCTSFSYRILMVSGWDVHTPPLIVLTDSQTDILSALPSANTLPAIDCGHNKSERRRAYSGHCIGKCHKRVGLRGPTVGYHTATATVTATATATAPKCNCNFAVFSAAPAVLGHMYVSGEQPAPLLTSP